MTDLVTFFDPGYNLSQVNFPSEKYELTVPVKACSSRKERATFPLFERRGREGKSRESLEVCVQVCFWLKVNDQLPLFSALSPEKSGKLFSIQVTFKIIQIVPMLGYSLDYRHVDFFSLL